MVEAGAAVDRGPNDVGKMKSVQWKRANKAVISAQLGPYWSNSYELRGMSWEVVVTVMDSGLIFTDKTFAIRHRNTKFTEVFSHKTNPLYSECHIPTSLIHTCSTEQNNSSVSNTSFGETHTSFGENSHFTWWELTLHLVRLTLHLVRLTPIFWTTCVNQLTSVQRLYHRSGSPLHYQTQSLQIL